MTTDDQTGKPGLALRRDANHLQASADQGDLQPRTLPPANQDQSFAEALESRKVAAAAERERKAQEEKEARAKKKAARRAEAFARQQRLIDRKRLTEAAITGLLASKRHGVTPHPQIIAMQAVGIADAALLELEEPTTPTHNQTQDEQE